MALKIVYPTSCGIDVHKTFVVACIASTNHNGITTHKNHRFSTYTSGLERCYNGCLKTIARMSAWNPPENIGFPSSMSLRKSFRLRLPIPNTSKPSGERKPTRKTPNELLTCLSTILLPEVLCPPR